MANKEALRELQLRLASRLQVARERPREAGWLAVETGGARLLLPLAQAGEIHTSLRVAPVPHAQPWLAGVANLRGELAVVVDLARFLRLRSPDDPASAGPAVALNASLQVNAALRVDRLVCLRDASQLTALADDAPRPAFVTAVWRDPLGQSWQGLDLALLASDPLFLNVAARTPPMAAPLASA